MSPMPLAMIVFFLLIVLLTLLAFGKAVHGSKLALGLALVWILVQSGLALSGFYLDTTALPPHFALAVVPPLVVVVGLALTRSGRQFLDGMELKWCVLIHAVRVLVELNLFWLFAYKQVPKLMTFEGGNIDILVGLSAPLIWWGYQRGTIGRRGLLVWNSLAVLGVLNALGRAMLSAPFRFQRFAFNQPTVAILHFPFVLLGAFVVPVVLLCHVVIFRKLRNASA